MRQPGCAHRQWQKHTPTAPAWCCCGFVPAGLLFFTTYTLLVLFWAEIYHQARSMPTGSLRPIFIAFNALVYACQVGNLSQHTPSQAPPCTAQHSRARHASPVCMPSSSLRACQGWQV